MVETLGEIIKSVRESLEGSPKMEKWEYKQETSEFHLTEQEFIDWLNEEGQKGWEMIEYRVGYEDDWGREKYTCIFKRKIQQG